jgi:actin related protein 2/3 complex subunit 2
MIVLEYANKILEDTLLRAFLGDKHEPISEMNISDFDGVTYHLHNPEGNVDMVHVSMLLGYISDLLPYGVGDAINNTYGSYVTDTEAGFDVTLAIDLNTLPENKAGLAHEVALLKRNLLSAPFFAYFDLVKNGTYAAAPTAAIKYRKNESLYIQAAKDRITVIFTVMFSDDDDKVLGQVFLNEFRDAKKMVKNCPPVDFSAKDPPLELSKVAGVPTGDNIGYITFVLFPRMWEGANRDEVVSLIMTFRNYLHYHIKCAKAYLHTRMRARVQGLLKVLNRAKMEPIAKAQKTAGGKTFVRAPAKT